MLQVWAGLWGQTKLRGAAGFRKAMPKMGLLLRPLASSLLDQGAWGAARLVTPSRSLCV